MPVFFNINILPYFYTYVEEEFERIVGQLLRFDNEYNELFLPLFADKELIVNKSDLERKIINLTKQKERIKKAYMSEVVELDDFKEDIKEFKDIEGIKLHIHPTFNFSVDDMPNEIAFDLNKDEKILKVIPIIKDIDNPESLSNRFKLGIITSTIKALE